MYFNAQADFKRKRGYGGGNLLIRNIMILFLFSRQVIF